MMWELALGAWSLTKQPLPDYSRADMSGRVIRPGDAGLLQKQPAP